MRDRFEDVYGFEAGVTSLGELQAMDPLPQAMWGTRREFLLTRMYEDASNFVAGPEGLINAVMSDLRIEAVRYEEGEPETPSHKST